MRKPLRYRELRKILAKRGISELLDRGKGSHRMFVGVADGKRVSYPVKCHNENQEYSVSVVEAIRRAFRLSAADGIPDDEFYLGK